jgi:signal peptidase I
MTIENASPFFAWDVSSYLALFLIIAFTIVTIDQLFFNKSKKIVTKDEQKSFAGKIFYFICFLRFNKSEKYLNRPKLVQWSAEFYPVLFLVFLLRGFLIEPFQIPSNSMMPTLLTGDFIAVSKFDYGISLPVLNKKIVEFKKPKRGDVIVFRYPNYEKNPSHLCSSLESFSQIKKLFRVRSDKQCNPDYIKRIIGIPGDKIIYHDDHLSVNGKKITHQDLGIYQGVESGVQMTGFKHKRELLDGNPHDILLSSNASSKAFKKCDENFISNIVENLVRKYNLNKPQAMELIKLHKDNTRNVNCSLKFSEVIPAGHYFVMGDNRDRSSDSRFWGFVPEEYIIGKAFGIWMHYDDSLKLDRVGGFD